MNINDIPVDISNHGQREALCRLPKWIFDEFKDIDAVALLVSSLLPILGTILKNLNYVSDV